ncbi:UDP-3-O-acyl-N-acetylglucosamine deacetylase [Acetobacter farinalis]|uniref:UDP-3-O-acyl-N-acetylglucosamine deacetylase n=1 Tax=Acetobacter farinalis TaxID=1260984 RepID=A0ABT3Q6T3_9PROT|nr:UDP-3-O-acyl-N-acetylglucosamine deacetylase [Acetobacter farinalis]MCX2560995.1 UDP-3-O-acyl-N-acetylglucosamine deacetylase [Acetobacter farinalis]NHO29755.1 UDP-3-O-acyl-N-acetylglucosamine deacetylase [Acetobacter farinalis]
MDSLLMEPMSRSATPEPVSGPAPAAVKYQPSVQHTLHQSISCVGTGLHTGARITLTLHPAPTGHGIVFKRSDLNAASLPARFDYVVDTRLSTVLGDATNPANRVATVEHLMAALNGCGIDNVLVLVSGPEVPVFDGSAADFVFLLDCAGRVAQDAVRHRIDVLRPIRVEQADGFAELTPAPVKNLHLALSIDFPAEAIGKQAFETELTADTFRHDLARNRTFTLRQEIEALHKAGLARGGSLDNAIVVDGAQILNPSGLRCPDEFIRHKVMDAVGDLYLAGAPLRARFTGHRSGHCLNNKVLRALFADPTAWRYVPAHAGFSRAAA